jgi:hypothetical protein
MREYIWMQMETGDPIVVLFVNATKGMDSLQEGYNITYSGQLTHSNMDIFFDPTVSTYFIVVVKGKNGWIYIREGELINQIIDRTPRPQPIAPKYTLLLSIPCDTIWFTHELLHARESESNKYTKKIDVLNFLYDKFKIAPRLNNACKVGIVEMIHC